MCASVSAKRTLVVSMSNRQTRLPLVRQRVNYSDAAGAKSWILDSPAATVGRSRSSHKQWRFTLRESNASVKHWRFTV